MAVQRDTFVDVNDGDQINEGYFNGIGLVSIKSVLEDQTGGTVTASTTETEIGEVQVPANIVDSEVLVVATGKFEDTTAVTQYSITLRLYGGTDTTGTNNTLFKTITRVYRTGGR